MDKLDYSYRNDGIIVVSIDNNCWDKFYEQKVDLKKEFPKDKFILSLVRGVKLETDPIEDEDFKKYIDHQIKSYGITITSTFGFDDGRDLQTTDTFGFGTFSSNSENEFIRIFHEKKPERDLIIKKNGLYKHEVDMDVALSSFHSVVITSDKKSFSINLAEECGGKVLFINDYPKNGKKISEMVVDYFNSTS